MSDNKLKVQSILDNVSKVIVGKDDVIKLVLTSVLSGGHVLLEDVPGTGKTMLAKTIAKSISGEFNRIQFTPDLLPSDITGIHTFNQKEGEFSFRQGPIFTNILLADEINRATPRTQSALLECMEEHQVTVDGRNFTLSEPFVVIATENPIETAGTYQLPEAQLDRFLMKIKMGYPDNKSEVEILNRFLIQSPLTEIEAVLSTEDVENMKKEVKNVYICQALLKYIVELSDATRKQPNVSIGVSPRGSISMVNAARAYAYINQRDYVIPEDIRDLAVSVWAHRLVLYMGGAGLVDRSQIIENVLAQVNVPTEDWNR
ncbi:MAG: AAA family ATPase [Lachnospira sp.]